MFIVGPTYYNDYELLLFKITQANQKTALRNIK